MDPAVVRRTQESLGKVIRKPPLTDKLLGKPPFRYLHDILTEVIRTTAFFKGLYTESELKSDNVKDKDAKISFLQKAIDVVILVTGEPLAVKPARVVAGHEPDKTNEFLQAIGKCCLNKLSSDDAVKRILSGEKVDLKSKPPSSSKSQDKENREAKDEERSHKEKEDKRETEIRESSGSRDRKDRQQLKEEEKEERERRKERERNGDTEKDGLREGEKNEKEKNRVRESRSETDKERSKEKYEREKGRERERRSEGNRGKEKDRTTERERNLDKEKDSEPRNRDRDNDHGERSRDREEEKTRTRDKERKRERDPERERRKERGRDTGYPTGRDEKPQDEERTERKQKAAEESTRKTSEVSSGKDKPITDKEKSLVHSKTSRPSASKLRERRPAKPSGEEEGRATELHTSESHDAAETNIAAQRKIPRPGSARPAPPRVRRQASAEVVVPERVSSGKGVSNVIVDQQKDDGDDDDNEFVVEEASPELSEMPKMDLEPELDPSGDKTHGSLVKKILETKKDYETPHDAVSKDKLLLTDTGRKKEKDLVTKEIEKLRGSIQILCRSALPLGKMMDYIQEDMDTMKNELQTWRTENREHAEVLQRERSITDTAVDPLKAELTELEQFIKEQRDKICTVKGNILRNEEKIQKMVQSIGVSGRD